jgi:hypothetical protein
VILVRSRDLILKQPTKANYTGLPVSFIQAGASAGWESGGENRKGGVIPGISKLKGADEWNTGIRNGNLLGVGSFKGHLWGHL